MAVIYKWIVEGTDCELNAIGIHESFTMEVVTPVLSKEAACDEVRKIRHVQGRNHVLCKNVSFYAKMEVATDDLVATKYEPGFVTYEDRAALVAYDALETIAARVEVISNYPETLVSLLRSAAQQEPGAADRKFLAEVADAIERYQKALDEE